PLLRREGGGSRGLRLEARMLDLFRLERHVTGNARVLVLGRFGRGRRFGLSAGAPVGPGHDERDYDRGSYDHERSAPTPDAFHSVLLSFGGIARSCYRKSPSEGQIKAFPGPDGDGGADGEEYPVRAPPSRSTPLTRSLLPSHHRDGVTRSSAPPAPSGSLAALRGDGAAGE